ncbi:TPA: NACHT domain-containing protein [Escherichia coli]|nr:NACHT domain-containing protein [Escherichia coli]
MDLLTSSAATLGLTAVNKMAETFCEPLAKSSYSLLQSVVTQKWKYGTDGAKTIIEKILEDETFSRYFDLCIKRYLSVRTLYNLNDDAFIDEFYHPLTIKNNRTGEALVINDNVFIQNENISNIIGYAGQGKTTILRKIFLAILSNKSNILKIPFFLDLRNLDNNSIQESLKKILTILELDCTSNDLVCLLKSKKVIILLDGFDEILPEVRETILKEMIYLNDSFQTQLISTSRPDTEICTTAGIDNFCVEQLTQSDVFSIISNFLPKVAAEQLIVALKNNKQLLSSINTPILAVLLCVCEKHLDSMPKNAKEFYHRIFNILFEGHDKTKNFYKRHRKTNLSISESKEIFCALCYISLKSSAQLSWDNLKDITRKSFKVLGLDYKDAFAEDLIDDYIDVTGLIRRDGAEVFTFVHKTIQEYHAAEFIKNSASSIKSKILSNLVKELRNNSTMLNTAVFLNHIDMENTTEELVIPLMKDIGFKEHDFSVSELADSFYSTLMGGAKVIVKNKELHKNKKKNINKLELKHDMSIGPFNDNILNVLAFSDVERLSGYSLHDIIFKNVVIEPNCFNIISQLDQIKPDGVINEKNSMCLDELLIKSRVKGRVLLVLGNLIEDMYNEMFLKLINNINVIKKEKESLLELDGLI